MAAAALRGPLLGASECVTVTTVLSLKVTDSFTSDGTSQSGSETQAVKELQALIRGLRELGPAAPQTTVCHMTSCVTPPPPSSFESPQKIK